MLKRAAHTSLRLCYKTSTAATAIAATPCQLCTELLLLRPRRIHVSASSNSSGEQPRTQAGPSRSATAAQPPPSSLPSYSTRLSRPSRPPSSPAKGKSRQKPYEDPYHLAEKLEELCEEDKLDEAVQLLRDSRSQAVNTAVYATVFKKGLKDRKNKLAWTLWMDVSQDYVQQTLHSADHSTDETGWLRAYAPNIHFFLLGCGSSFSHSILPGNPKDHLQTMASLCSYPVKAQESWRFD